MSSYEFDIHTHTIASGHGSSATITDMAKAASAAGLTTLGISDHGPATLGGGRPSYFMNLAYAQRKRLGIRMLYGAEANILDYNGKLDLPESILKNLDYVIASMHKPTIRPGTEEENTRAYIAAVDYFKLFKAAMENHVLLEINNSSLSPDGYRGNTKFNDLLILNLSVHFNYPVLFSSDSHGKKHVGDFTYAEEAAKLAGVPYQLILNHSAKAFLGFIGDR